MTTIKIDTIIIIKKNKNNNMKEIMTKLREYFNCKTTHKNIILLSLFIIMY